MYSEDRFREELDAQSKEDKKLREIMKKKGRSLKRAETAFASLTDSEKIFINHYLNDGCLSFGSAVIKSGLADNLEDAVNIGIALSNNDRILKAIEEIKSLGGINPTTIKEGVYNLALNAKQEGIRLQAFQTLGKYLGMEQQIVKHVQERSIDMEEVKQRVSGTVNDIVEEAEVLIRKLKEGNSDGNFEGQGQTASEERKGKASPETTTSKEKEVTVADDSFGDSEIGDFKIYPEEDFN